MTGNAVCGVVTERRRRMLAEKGEKNREEEVCEEEATIWMKDEDLRMRFVLFKLRISLHVSGCRGGVCSSLGKVGRSKI